MNARGTHHRFSFRRVLFGPLCGGGKKQKEGTQRAVSCLLFVSLSLWLSWSLWRVCGRPVKGHRPNRLSIAPAPVPRSLTPPIYVHDARLLRIYPFPIQTLLTQHTNPPPANPKKGMYNPQTKLPLYPLPAQSFLPPNPNHHPRPSNQSSSSSSRVGLGFLPPPPPATMASAKASSLVASSTSCFFLFVFLSPWRWGQKKARHVRRPTTQEGRPTYIHHSNGTDLLRDPACVVRRQQHVHPVVDVAPLRVVVHLIYRVVDVGSVVFMHPSRSSRAHTTHAAPTQPTDRPPIHPPSYPPTFSATSAARLMKAHASLKSLNW